MPDQLHAPPSEKPAVSTDAPWQGRSSIAGGIATYIRQLEGENAALRSQVERLTADLGYGRPLTSNSDGHH